MESKFLVNLYNFSKHQIEKNSKIFGMVKCKVEDVTLSSMQWFEVFYPTKDKANLIIEVVELLNKVTC
jgi:hypothetical protein